VEGGIDYWATFTNVARADDLTVVAVHLFDHEDEPDEDGAFPTYAVDALTVAAGVQNILSANATNDEDLRSKCHIRDDLFTQVMSLFRGEDDWDVDADAADCIVQAGLFGEVRYG
jgi:hypothetical protein